MLKAFARDAVPHSREVTILGLELANAEVPGLIKAGRMLQEAEIRMLQAGLEKIHRAIVRKTVHDDDFVDLIQPWAHRAQMLRHESSGVSGGYDNAYWKHV